MNKYIYNGVEYNTTELSEMSGVAVATLRDRLRRGYTVEQAMQNILVHQSVEMFAESSYWKDWIGMSTTYLYEIYSQWCISNAQKGVSQQAFTRQLLSMYPNLKTVPTRLKFKSESGSGNGNDCCRIIRER